jgi:hypothetical protein
VGETLWVHLIPLDGRRIFSHSLGEGMRRLVERKLQLEHGRSLFQSLHDFPNSSGTDYFCTRMAIESSGLYFEGMLGKSLGLQVPGERNRLPMNWAESAPERKSLSFR